ncbi:hypothetical protein GPECTOR_12g414 [Gonium pectorale]|uniref:Uncharacterized protein n=1 Tax=Gonium pectorale TaxID=33097 RepID=A0A150GNS2_GONPE|nr:hypothetical protein GPECTOR_12g414 [Gonium pectorale]|eukprot:KXZ51451.1 hypothetical protein GPECTOR_12g414 [Gonium pectorale]
MYHWNSNGSSSHGGSAAVAPIGVSGVGRTYNTAEHEAVLAAVAASLGGSNARSAGRSEGGGGDTGAVGGVGLPGSGSSAFSRTAGDEELFSELRKQLGQLERSRQLRTTEAANQPSQPPRFRSQAGSDAISGGPSGAAVASASHAALANASIVDNGAIWPV